MTSEELDKIAELAWKRIIECKAQTSWMYAVGLWMPDDLQDPFLPMKQMDINAVANRIFKLAKKGNTNAESA